MSEVAQLKPTAKPVPLNHSQIYGQILSARKVKSVWITLIVLPRDSADEFSHPPTVELISSNSLGKPKETWEGLVRLNGYRRRVNPKPDAETGEVRDSYYTADARLSVVE